MDIAVQRIRVTWTKRSRGGGAAARRNAVPAAFPLPDEAQPFVHRVTMSEAEDFLPRHAVERVLPEDVALEERDGRLLVSLRDGRARDVPLGRGQTLRWRINKRVTPCCGPPYYLAVTLNVVYGRAAGETFLHRPVRVLDERHRML
ncbi:hypothetical protein [Actinomadura terrae]|uniref:hypothetical protein n=1 Tax=Actinomadura terrae TaxID=604353 RepID=UPI001FA78CC6|nr:hypothetical protein [Actinomadura terrae]